MPVTSQGQGPEGFTDIDSPKGESATDFGSSYPLRPFKQCSRTKFSLGDCDACNGLG
jgi:hypothetical protein